MFTEDQAMRITVSLESIAHSLRVLSTEVQSRTSQAEEGKRRATTAVLTSDEQEGVTGMRQNIMALKTTGVVRRVLGEGVPLKRRDLTRRMSGPQIANLDAVLAVMVGTGEVERDEACRYSLAESYTVVPT